MVNQAYFELIERKAELLDGMTDGTDSIIIGANDFKALSKITKDWDKIEASDLAGSAPYEEPAE